MSRQTEFRQTLCADTNGNRAARSRRCAADDRDALKKDGTTHLVMSPLEFMQRLAALVPRPRLHLIRFHGLSVRFVFVKDDRR